MRKLLLFAFFTTGILSMAQQKVNQSALEKIAAESNEKFQEAKNLESSYLKNHTFPTNVSFQGFSSSAPVFLSDDSRPQIISMDADYIHDGQITNPVTGNGMVAYIWDSGSVRLTHQEFTNRVTNVESTTNSDHSTGVAGVIMGAGTNANSKGIAYEATLKSNNYNNNLAELAEASNASENSQYMISNHSYGSLCGWYHNDSNDTWYWYGYPSISETESVLFGVYTSDDAKLDEIAYNAPQHSMFKSSGNNHSEGPDGAVNHYVLDNSNNWVLISDGTVRPKDCTETGGYDCLSFAGSVAKNSILVGAISPISGGGRYDEPSDVVETWFTSFGPTDDGRIKPDVTAIGENVFGPTAGSDTGYTQWSGTSFSTPAAAGVALLLEQLENQKTDGASYLRSDMMKALLTHTANESGDALGPDYKFGYGLINAFRAAETILNTNENSITENRNLNNSETYTFTVTALGDQPIKATIAWIDPAGTPITPLVLNDRTPMLVNDLDLRLTNGGNTYYPWKLNPENPSAAATQEDNIVDNVEQVYIPNPIANQEYTITISHKGSLVNNSQNYALVVTGINSPLSTKEVDFSKTVTIYPNPVNDFMNLKMKQNLTNVDMKIFNAMGQVVWVDHMDKLKSNQSISLQSLSAGNYMIYIKSDQGIVTKKVLKK